jgi:type II secretory pathway pseudopilin PulG
MHLKRKHWQFLTERGDTIVEVLIAIGIISTVMSGAFVTTNHSLTASRNAQERLNATKLLESQIELAKSVAAANPNALFGAGVPAHFCLTSAAAVVIDTNASCTVDTSGNPIPSTSQPAFHLTVSRSGNTFTFTDTWTAYGGQTTNNVFMEYRLYQPS